MFGYILVIIFICSAIILYQKYQPSQQIIEKNIEIPYKQGKVVLQSADFKKRKYLGLKKIGEMDGKSNYTFDLYDEIDNNCYFDCYKDDVDRLYNHYKNSRMFMFMKEKQIKEKLKGKDFIESELFNQAIKCCELVKHDNGNYFLKFTGRQFCGAYEELCLSDEGGLRIAFGEPAIFKVINID
ncbi:MAG: hypothetical protein Edafosvirus34_10 [Edafosvirus sp.]|uniref:Uncharacterized protein n=1 Tax=Edafosvirus sp. TaxID=2487765 RepID=A0A3G4ZV99_9VIRU|nr:MAG: hypothetical protein Edafosvirus34_10 [Edafosvirus sp.]